MKLCFHCTFTVKNDKYNYYMLITIDFNCKKYIINEINLNLAEIISFWDKLLSRYAVYCTTVTQPLG